MGHSLQCSIDRDEKAERNNSTERMEQDYHHWSILYHVIRTDLLYDCEDPA